jgi:hypothetical protein
MSRVAVPPCFIAKLVDFSGTMIALIEADGDQALVLLARVNAALLQSEIPVRNSGGSNVLHAGHGDASGVKQI